jgi:hypothetical protein
MEDQPRVVLLCNVGNRDLLLQGQEIRPARPRGKEILDSLVTHQADLSLPIIMPAILTIQADAPEAAIDIMLFCTDQQGVSEKFRENDTLHFGECIRKTFGGRQPVRRVMVRTVHRNPTMYDSMFAFFEEQFDDERSQLSAYERVFISLAGGIPACNMALCLQAIQAFGERCIALYPLEGHNRAVPLQIGTQLLTSAKQQLVREQLRNYEYAAAAMVLDTLSLPIQASLARLAVYRLNFDFPRAQHIIASLIGGDLGEVRSYALEVDSEFGMLRNMRLPSLIEELYWNATIKFHQEEYLDFLGRLFRFQEAVLRHCLETSELNLTTSIDADNLRFKRFQASVQRYPGLVTYLETQRYNSVRLEWQEPYTPCLMAILRYLVENGRDDARPQRQSLLTTLEEIDRLSPLRNKSPLGHGFDGISLEKIHERVPGFSPVCLIPILQYSGLYTDAFNPYDRLNTIILRAL